MQQDGVSTQSLGLGSQQGHAECFEYSLYGTFLNVFSHVFCWNT